MRKTFLSLAKQSAWQRSELRQLSIPEFTGYAEALDELLEDAKQR